jgi:hypothetical protein
MSHLDEGTLHALLDGELGSTELMEIEAHLAGCSACSTRLRTAREFLEEADRLVGSVQFGNYASAPAASSAQRPTPKPEPVPVPQSPERPSREHHPWDDASPVLLIPDNPETSPLIRRWTKFVGWAAMIALVAGGGYLASNVAKESSVSIPTSPDAGSTIAARSDSDVPSNAAPSARRDSVASVLADETAPADVGLKQAPAKPAAAKPAPVKSAQAKPAPGTTDGKKTLAGNLTAKTTRPEAKDENIAGTADSADAAEEAATKAAEQESIRLQAAEALTQLDRERRVNRAAAATAALDQQAAARRTTTTPAAPPPPPSPEQRSQVYLRIGLDEANRQLGGPVHVIEGLNPLFMGLAPGRVAVGADTTRPVVRVVYQDAQGRMIVLDQQRSRPGQGALPAGAWSLGDVTMGLQGDVPPEVLRSLRSRVR